MATKHLFLITLSTALSASAQIGTSTDLILGHYEVQIDYATPSSGTADDGWALGVSFDEDDDFNSADDITRLDPSNVRLLAAPTGEISITSALSQFGEIGDPLWLLPQSNEIGQLFLGLRVVIDQGLFQTPFNGSFLALPPGGIVWEMTNVTGSGPELGGYFGMWESERFGTLDFHFSTADGIDENDRLPTVETGAHTHYNWGMTKPGSYDVTFRVSGRLMNGTDTSNETTFQFYVPFSGYSIGTAACRANDSVELPSVLYRSDEDCEYAPNQIALITENQTHQSNLELYGFTLSFESGAPAARSRVGVPGNDPLPLPANQLLADPPYLVTAVDGPGTLDTAPLGATEFGFSFSESGIYRVTLVNQYEDAGDASLSQSEPYELVFLAGLDVDYSYAEWADSFERTHQLPSGSLADSSLDFDNDRVPNAIEYQLFWHGFDPGTADAGKLPMPKVEDGYALIEFIRDTYKDNLADSPIRFTAAHNSDLTSTDWNTWVSVGKPDEIFESSAEPDLDVGYIMNRRLRVPNETAPAFFRFEQL